nr:unnamed protein product [Spirometra erinaceieuropaei]
MRSKAPLPRSGTINVNYRVQCNSCEANYVGETGKRLQIRVDEHIRAVRRVDPLSLVAEHCADFGHTFAFQGAKILGRGNDRVARETIEAWHTETTSINRCAALPAAYEALRTQFNERNGKREVRLDLNLNTGERTTDLHLATPQIGPDEDGVINTVASTTTPEDGEKRGQRDAIKTSNPGRQLRSTRMRVMATKVQMPAPAERQQSDSSHPHSRSAPATTETIPARMWAISAIAD